MAMTQNVREKYEALGGPHSFLGEPVGDMERVPNDRSFFQQFEYGAIFWPLIFTDAGLNLACFEIHGAIYQAWKALPHDIQYSLSFATSDETACPDGVGRFNTFETGDIYWTGPTGAHFIWGAIRDKWKHLGAESGFGYPVTDEQHCPDGIGHFQHFQNGGSIYHLPALQEAHEVHGAIRDKWASLGWERGKLGYPVTDELSTQHVKLNQFQGGYIFWNGYTGAYEVDHDMALIGFGWNQDLGYLVGDTQVSFDGIGRKNAYQTGFVVSPRHTWPYWVEGAMAQKWVAAWMETGFLGYPYSDPGKQTDGGIMQDFDFGTICQSAHGVHEVHGGIVLKWKDLPHGWVNIEQSQLGYPTSDEQVAGDGTRYSQFEHGTICWTGSKGAYLCDGPPSPPPPPPQFPDVTFANYTGSSGSGYGLLIVNPTSPNPGQSFTIAWTDWNSGNKATGPFKDRIALTRDSDGYEMWSDTQDVPALQQGQMYSHSKDADGLDEDYYTITVTLDADQDIAEWSEANNQASWGLRVTS